MAHSIRLIKSRAADAVELYLQSWTGASPAPKIHVLFVHGYLEHSGRYGELAKGLCEKNPDVKVTAFDQRGHGKSGGARSIVKNWVRETLMDLDTVISKVAEDTPDAKLFVLGHSNGGLQVLDYYLNGKSLMKEQTSAPLAGLIISSPFLAPADALPWIKVMASKILGRFVPSLTIPTELPVEHLTSDKAKQDEHDADTLILDKISVGWGFQGMKAQARVGEALDDLKGDSIQFPLLFAYAGGDRVASPTANAEAATKLEAALSHVKVVRREKDEHEIFQEANRVELYDIVSDWLAETAGG